MLQRLAAAVRGRRQGGTVPAFVALVAMTAFFGSTGEDPCEDSCNSTARKVEDEYVQASLKYLAGAGNGASVTLAASASQVGRALIVEAKTAPVGAPVRVLWTPAEGATGVTFTPGPTNPQGPPPYVFENVPAKAAGGTTPSITVRYSVPAAPGPSVTLVDGVELVDSNGNHYAYAYAEGGSASPAPASATAGDGSPRGDGADDAVLLDRRLYEAQTWIYGHDTPLTEQSCQAYVDFLQSRKAFVAFRFPVEQRSSLAAAETTGYYLPMSLRASADTYPVLSFEHRSASSVPLPNFRLEFAPEWLSWVENHLPGAVGERWMTLAVPSSPKVTCTPGLNIPEGGWELYVSLPFDLGPGAGMPDRVVSVYACSEGDEPPPLFPATRAAAAPRPLSSRADVQVLAAGPVPVRVPGELAGPTITVDTGSVRRITPPAAVALHFEVGNRGDSTEVNLAATTTGATSWRLYRGTATTPNTGQPVSGPISIGRNAVHVWAVGDVGADSSGLEVVTLTATNLAVPGETVWNTALLWLGELSGQGQTTWVPVASHASGANQSQWRTDLGLLNLGSTPGTAEVTLHAGTTAVSKAFTVGSGEQRILADVVGQLPFTGSGSLEILSDVPLKVSSRTYNLVAGSAACYPGGTFGQGYDAVATTGGLATGEIAWLNQLVETSAYRTNIALTNTGTTPATVLVELYDGAGGRLANYGVELRPGEWKQENRPFSAKAGQTNLTRGYALVTVTAGAGVIATASLIDNITNDPTTMNMVRSIGGASTRMWIPVASHASGANQSQWRTDLGVFIPGMVAANLELRLHAGGSVKTSSASVAPTSQAIFADVVGQFPYTGSGAVEVVSSQAMVASSRTYNLVAPSAACYPGGTFGQEYRASRTSEGLAAGESGWLTQLVETAAYRTNIALTNTGTAAAAVKVELFDRIGTRVAQYDVPLAAGEWKQENRPFSSKAGRTDITAGYAKVTVTSGSGIVASASVVDNATNDPTTMALMR